ncbi:hypothetical protein [Rhodospirillum sp. A1_3_36]|uniref:hypothetical protein n=1 Tax=Rhodospirillum sp. A1_3_36 TaxID=3391666 RepID=UPI0039A40EBB
MPITYEDILSEKMLDVIKSEDQIPRDVLNGIFKIKSDPDIVTPIKKGKEWLYGRTIQHQERTGRILFNGGDLFIRSLDGSSFGSPGISYKLMQEVNGRLISIERENIGDNVDLHDIDGYYGRHLSLPDPIRLAYYQRFDGLNAPEETTWGIRRILLPLPIVGGWSSIDNYLKRLRLKKKYLPLIEEMIPGVRPKDLSMESYTNFMMFLDSRYSRLERKGDVLFVKNHIQDKVVYHIKDADVPNMRILADPKEAIDRYCEHVLLRKEGRFDFLPYTTEFTG